MHRGQNTGLQKVSGRKNLSFRYDLYMLWVTFSFTIFFIIQRNIHFRNYYTRRVQCIVDKLNLGV